MPLGYEHLIEAMEANEEFGKRFLGELFPHPKQFLELHESFDTYDSTDTLQYSIIAVRWGC